MNDADLTLTSPITRVLQAENPLLCLTIIWHPIWDALESKRLLPANLSPSADITATHQLIQVWQSGNQTKNGTM